MGGLRLGRRRVRENEVVNLAVKIESKETILVVDDNAEVRGVLAEIVTQTGYSVVEAESAAHAICVLKEQDIDLVLTDMQMPGQTGLDLIGEVRSIDDSIPVILITGFASVDTAVDAMKRGAVDFISKPFEFHNVQHLIRKALQERRLRQENRRLQADVNNAAVIEKLNRELNSKLGELTRLYAISETMTQIMDTDEIFEQMVNVAAEVTGARRVSLMMLDRGRHSLRIRAAKGIPADVIERTRIMVGEAVAGGVAMKGVPVRVTRATPEVSAEARNHPDIYNSSSWICLPLFIGDQTYGVLNLTDKADNTDFDEQDQQIVQILLEKAGTKLENQALYEGIYANMIDSLNALVTTIEAKDVYTREHSSRVTEYALTIGRILGVNDAELEMMEFAGILHDIGKIGVHDEILTKSGRLTDAEYEAIKEHPLIGERIVAPLGLTAVESAIVRSHHERYDGKGYPDGLKGEETPFLARIVGVADAFDAMTTTRSYRKALSMETAIEELRRNRGTQFDPDVVDAMLLAIERGEIVVPESATVESTLPIEEAI